MSSSPWGHQLLGVAAVGGWLGLLSALAIWVRGRWPEQREWSRKVVHIGCGPVMLIAWAWGIERWIAVSAAVVITLLAALNHRMRVLPAIEDVNRHSYGTIAYGASISLLLLLYWDHQPIAAVVGVLVMAIGDGLAGLLGPLVTSPSWQVFQQRRSLVGTAVMALASLLVLVVMASFGPAPATLWLLAIAAVATALEQCAVLGIDNLSVPISVGWLWQALSQQGSA